MTAVFAGDIGTEFILDCGVDISTATVRKIIVRKPVTGERVEWTAIAEGTTAIKYTTILGDISTAGIMTVQAYIEMPTWKGYGSKVNVTINSPI